MNGSTSPHLEAPASEWLNGWLRFAIVAAAVLPVLMAGTITSAVPFETRQWAAILWILCLAPAWVYLRTAPERRPPMPFLPVVGLLYGIYFALPVATGAVSSRYTFFTLSVQTDLAEPVELALLGWAILLLTYAGLGILVPPSRDDREGWEYDTDVLRWWGTVLLATGVAVEASSFLVTLPPIIAGLASFARILSWYGAGLLIVLYYREGLSGPQRAVLIGGVGLLFTLHLVSGTTARLAFLAAAAFSAVWIGRRSLGVRWIVGLVLVVSLMLTLRSVIPEYRRMVWFRGGSSTAVERVDLMMHLLQTKMQKDGLAAAAVDGAQASGRAGTVLMFADVVRRTPEAVPFWSGDTYLSLVGAFVPRFLWPTKPTKNLGSEFGHRYRYLDPADNHTSINFPYLVEFYANYGAAGVLIGMMLVGAIYRVLRNLVNRPGQDVLTSLAAVVLLVPLFNIESDFSLIFGGLILQGGAVWFLVRTIRRKAIVAGEDEPEKVAAEYYGTVHAR